ncbi:MAG: hypothetical protein L6R38_004583 [Xanthoria sp. 2 TBL-2021]|nr:MAG: hypothetical protein L6R38_004583 [Xanthoria sp. 2 TBL-2021]
MTAKDADSNDGGVADSERVILLQDTGVITMSPPSSKLRMFAVDQLLFDGRFEPEPETATNNTYQFRAAEIMAVEDFNRDLLERLLECGGCGCENPAAKGSRYLKVLDYGIWGLDSS